MRRGADSGRDRLHAHNVSGSGRDPIGVRGVVRPELGPHTLPPHTWSSVYQCVTYEIVNSYYSDIRSTYIIFHIIFGIGVNYCIDWYFIYGGMDQVRSSNLRYEYHLIIQ